MFLVLCGNSNLGVLINFVLIKKKFNSKEEDPGWLVNCIPFQPKTFTLKALDHLCHLLLCFLTLDSGKTEHCTALT